MSTLEANPNSLEIGGKVPVEAVQGSRPIEWTDHLDNDIELRRTIAENYGAAATYFMKPQIYEHVRDIGKEVAERIDGELDLSRTFLNIMHGGSPFAAMLSEAVTEANPAAHSPIFLRHLRMSRYGSSQVGTLSDSSGVNIEHHLTRGQLHGRDITLIDEVIDKGDTLSNTGLQLLDGIQIPPKELVDATLDLEMGRIGIRDFMKLMTELSQDEAMMQAVENEGLVSVKSVDGIVLCDKGIAKVPKNLYNRLDVLFRIANLWGSGFGMDSPNERYRHAPHLFLSATQEIGYADKLPAVAEKLGELLVVPLAEFIFIDDQGNVVPDSEHPFK